MLVLGLTIAVVAEILVLLGAYTAYQDRFFFPSQMKARGFAQGFPYVVHLGMWSDFFLISPILGVLTALYANQWSETNWLISVLIGTIVSFALHYLVYLKGNLPGSAGYNGRLTISGWIHLIYTAYALAILALFYFSTSAIGHSIAIILSLLLSIHVLLPFLGQTITNRFHPDWFPENPLKLRSSWIALIVIWIFIIWRCMQIW